MSGSCWPYPDRFADRHLPVPREPAHQILPGLWMGGLLEGDVSADFDRTLTLAGDYPPGEREEVRPMRDGRQVPAELAEVAAMVRGWLEAGDRVLVRCEAGLNRSGLVVAQVLIDLGFHPEVAIQHIRHRRSAHALSNPAFCAHLRVQDEGG